MILYFQPQIFTMNHDCRLIIVLVIEITINLWHLRAGTQCVGSNTPGGPLLANTAHVQALTVISLPPIPQPPADCKGAPASFCRSSSGISLLLPAPCGNSTQLPQAQVARGERWKWGHPGPIFSVSRRGARCQHTHSLHAIQQTTTELPAPC